MLYYRRMLWYSLGYDGAFWVRHDWRDILMATPAHFPQVTILVGRERAIGPGRYVEETSCLSTDSEDPVSDMSGGFQTFRSNWL